VAGIKGLIEQSRPMGAAEAEKLCQSMSCIWRKDAHRVAR
jgi:hypothetical protein